MKGIPLTVYKTNSSVFPFRKIRFENIENLKLNN